MTNRDPTTPPGPAQSWSAETLAGLSDMDLASRLSTFARMANALGEEFERRAGGDPLVLALAQMLYCFAGLSLNVGRLPELGSTINELAAKALVLARIDQNDKAKAPN